MNEDYVRSSVTEINSCIGTAAKRQHGLTQLAKILETLASSGHKAILEQNTLFWYKTLLQIFENHPVSLHAKLAHYCFYLLVQNSKNLSPELSRAVSTTLIEKSVNALINSNAELSKNALTCLNELISCYKASCAQYKQRIETFVFSKLDSNSDDVLKWASICYAKLPFLHKNANNSDIWYSYFKNMIINANSILNDLFEDILPVDKEFDIAQNAENAGQKLTQIFTKLNRDPENIESYLMKLFKRFKACCHALSCLLSPLNDSVILDVRPREVLLLLKRIFCLDMRRLIASSSLNSEALFLSLLASEIVNCGLTLAQKFFRVLNTNLIIHSTFINGTFSVLAGNLHEDFLFGSVATFYETLTEWMRSLGANSGLIKSSSSIIDNIMENIKPFKTDMLLIEKQNGPKTAKHLKHQEGQSADSTALFFENKLQFNSHQAEARNRVITSALTCLETYIKCFSNELSFTQLEKIQQTVVDVILSVQNNSHARKPYQAADCRLSLYKVLFELCLSQNIRLAPPLSIAVNLFRNALNDDSIEVKSFSRSSLNVLRAFVNPIMPIHVKKFEEYTDTNAPFKQQFYQQQFTGAQNQLNSLNLTRTQSQQAFQMNYGSNNGMASRSNAESVGNLTYQVHPAANGANQSFNDTKQMDLSALDAMKNSFNADVTGNKRKLSDPDETVLVAQNEMPAKKPANFSDRTVVISTNRGVNEKSAALNGKLEYNAKLPIKTFKPANETVIKNGVRNKKSNSHDDEDDAEIIDDDDEFEDDDEDDEDDEEEDDEEGEENEIDETNNTGNGRRYQMNLGGESNEDEEDESCVVEDEEETDEDDNEDEFDEDEDIDEDEELDEDETLGEPIPSSIEQSSKSEQPPELQKSISSDRKSLNMSGTNQSSAGQSSQIQMAEQLEGQLTGNLNESVLSQTVTSNSVTSETTNTKSEPPSQLTAKIDTSLENCEMVDEDSEDGEQDSDEEVTETDADDDGQPECEEVIDDSIHTNDSKEQRLRLTETVVETSEMEKTTILCDLTPPVGNNTEKDCSTVIEVVPTTEKQDDNMDVTTNEKNVSINDSVIQGEALECTKNLTCEMSIMEEHLKENEETNVTADPAPMNSTITTSQIGRIDAAKFKEMCSSLNLDLQNKITENGDSEKHDVTTDLTAPTIE